MSDLSSILAVDDQSESLQLLAGILQSEGYDVRLADSGELALAAVATRTPDLILLDLHMPVMDGFEVCRRLKAASESRNIPLMFISDSSDTEEQLKGFKLGAVDFISKPVRREDLLPRVKAQLDLNQGRIQLEEQLAERTEELRLANEQFLRELAERKRIQAVLDESEERTDALFKQAAVGIAQLTNAGRFQLFNDRLCEILGYTRSELFNKTFLDVTWPDDRSKLLDGHRRLLVGEISSWSTDTRSISKDGSLVWSRLFLSIVRDQNGSPLYFLGVMEDVTDGTMSERARKISELRLKLAESAAHVAVWERDLSTNVISFSEEYPKLYGLDGSNSRLHFEEWIGLIHVDDRDRIRALTRGTTEKNHVWDTEFRVVWPDGSVHWLLGKGEVQLDDSGRPTCILGINLDITGRKQAEERFRLAVEAAPNGVVMVDRDGKIVLVNSQAEKMFGYDRVELLGQPLEILVPESARSGHTDFRSDYFSRPLVRLIKSGMQLNGRRKDGTYFPIEIGLNPVETLEGILVLTSIVDVSEMHRAEAALRESEERFKFTADTAPVMIAVSDADKLATFFNKRWLAFTGRSFEHELGRGWLELVHPDDREACYASYSASFDARRNCHLEFRLRRADGEYRWILCDGGPRFAENGVFVGYIGSAVDITDVKHAQEHAASIQKFESLGRVAAGVAHGFNNLLGGILTNSELALSEIAAGSAARDDVQRIKAITIRASEIIGELMTYAGQIDSSAQSVDVSTLVEEMLDLLKLSISKRATLVTNLGKKLGMVQGDPSQLRQIVLNLIVNAAEAIPEKGGLITVTTRRKYASGGATLKAGDCIQLEVSDTGCGITQDMRAKIFDPFFSTKFSGRGLGLAVVAGIVRQHRGDIIVESTPGAGTTFQVLLPCSDSELLSNTSIASTEPVPVRSGTVLLVEDEDSLRFVASKALRKRGLSVVEASDGLAALELFRQYEGSIDVVLLDVTLPGLSGVEVLTELRRVRPGIKVLLTSAYSRATVGASFGDQDISGFIRKPYHIGELMTLLQEALTNRSQVNSEERLPGH